MAIFQGRRTVSLQSQQAADLARAMLAQWAGDAGGPRGGEGEGAGFYAFAANGRPAWTAFYPGDEATPGSVVPFGAQGEGLMPWSQDLNALVAESIRRGGLTAGEFARALNAHQPLSKAVVNADGTISFDQWSYDDQFDAGLVILGAGVAGLGYLSGGFGLGELFGAGGSGAGSALDVIEEVGNFTGGGSSAGISGGGAGSVFDVIEEVGNFTGGGSPAGSGAGSVFDVIEEVGNFTGGAGSASGSGLPLPPASLPPGSGGIGQQLINQGVNALKGLVGGLLGGGEPDPLPPVAPSQGGAPWLLLAACAGVVFIATR